MVSAYRPNGQTQIKYPDLVKRVKYPRTPIRARPTSLLGGLRPALTLRHKVTVRGRREPRPTTTWVEPPAPSAPNSEQYHRQCNSVKYIVYARDHFPK